MKKLMLCLVVKYKQNQFLRAVVSRETEGLIVGFRLKIIIENNVICTYTNIYTHTYIYTHTHIYIYIFVCVYNNVYNNNNNNNNNMKKKLFY